ncbi:MAG: beta-N-acetylhexosaminidase [Janthinobacterium lividum]
MQQAKQNSLDALDLTRRGPGPVMIDVPGTVLDETDVRRIAHPLTGGVILFARNYQNRAQLSLLTHQIRMLRPDILIAVDQEGGRVQRFRTDGFTTLPPMRRLGELWDEDVLAAVEAATATGFVLGSELRASGIDLSFTPVLDLDYGVSKAIGSRAFHRDPRVVTLLARSLTHGLSLAGMANCAKHFPGHGYVEADTHLGPAIDDRPLDEILQNDARPFLWSGLAISSVMAAHVIYPQVDALPAGFSRIWLQRVLRRELGFHGAIFSDDLSMEGARVAGDVVRGAKMALDAGCDMVLVCNCPEEAENVLTGLRHTASRQSVRRIRRLQARGKAVPWSKLPRLPEYQAARARVEALVKAMPPA